MTVILFAYCVREFNIGIKKDPTIDKNCRVRKVCCILSKDNTATFLLQYLVCLTGDTLWCDTRKKIWNPHFCEWFLPSYVWSWNAKLPRNLEMISGCWPEFHSKPNTMKRKEQRLRSIISRQFFANRWSTCFSSVRTSQLSIEYNVTWLVFLHEFNCCNF